MCKWFSFVTDPFKWVLLLASFNAIAEDSLEKISVMSLSSPDQVAVIKLDDGSMQALNIGDSIPNSKAVLVEVLSDKLVLEETVLREGKLSIKQLVWVYQAVDGQSRLQRLDKVGPGPVVIEKPVMIELDTEQVKKVIKEAKTNTKK